MVTERIETIPNARVRALGHHPPELCDRWTDTDTARIKTLQVVLIYISSSILELQDSLTQQSARQDAGVLERLRKAANFVVREKEGPILEDRPANTRADAIVVRRWLGNFVAVVVPGVSVERRVLVEPINGAVEGVCPALADNGDLPAGRPGKRSIFVGDFDAEFIDALDANRDDGLLRGASGNDVIGDVNAVDDRAVLVAARSGDRAAAISEAALVAVIRCRTGLEC